MQHGKLPGYNSIGRRESPGTFPGIPLKGLMDKGDSVVPLKVQLFHLNKKHLSCAEHLICIMLQMQYKNWHSEGHMLKVNLPNDIYII